MSRGSKTLRPILFNTEMVQAIKDGRKTMTRRIVKLDEEITEPGRFERFDDGGFQFHFEKYPSIYDYPIYPPVYEGDILYVRETWAKLRFRKPTVAIQDDFKEEKIVFRADGEIANSDGSKFLWKPSIFMPKGVARIFLRVKSVRVEPLREMVLADVLNEGILEELTYEETWNKWHSLWNATISKSDLPKYGWDANPWVYVICFEKLDISSYEEATVASWQ